MSVLGHVVAKCTAKVAVLIFSKNAKVTGGKQTRVVLKTPADWCDYYGVKVVRGVATLFKAVDDDYSTDKARRTNVSYKPGKKPVAPDWDGGKAECGGGLHFSPTQAMARAFNNTNKFVACQVRLKDMRAPKYDDRYPEKIKAKCVCKPIYEVNEDGERLK